jgi:hypothetical protein
MVQDKPRNFVKGSRKPLEKNIAENIAVGSWQSAVSSQQSAVSSWQLAVRLH